MVFQQKPFEKADFICLLTGSAKVRPASSDNLKAHKDYILPGLVSMSLIMITTGSSWISSGSGSWGWTSAWPVLVSITNVYDSSPGPNDCKKIVLHGKVLLVTSRLLFKDEAATYHSVLKKFTQYYIYSHNTYQGLEWKEIWDLRNDVFGKAIWLTEWLTDWLMDGLTDGWTDWLTGGLNDWLPDWLTDGRTDGRMDWRTDWLADWLTGWLAGWLADWLTGWLAGCLSVCLTDISCKSLTQKTAKKNV